MEKLFTKDNFTYDVEIKAYICPFGEILYEKQNYEYKTNKCTLFDKQI